METISEEFNNKLKKESLKLYKALKMASTGIEKITEWEKVDKHIKSLLKEVEKWAK
ncbi:MAG: hypothetical protein ACUZ8I_04555 [Candidatus Scalindua sp.]